MTEFLEEDEAKEHQGWLAATGNNQDLLDNYVDELFFLLKKIGCKKGMRFWIRSNTAEDELRALFVFNIDYYSNAIGDNDLSISGSFLRTVAQPDLP